MPKPLILTRDAQQDLDNAYQRYLKRTGLALSYTLRNGSSLITSGLDQCRKLNIGAVAVLGHPGYYSKFGFSPDCNFGIDCEYEVPKEVFMLKELIPVFLDNVSGTIRYHEAFKNV